VNKFASAAVLLPLEPFGRQKMWHVS